MVGGTFVDIFAAGGFAGPIPKIATGPRGLALELIAVVAAVGGGSTGGGSIGGDGAMGDAQLPTIGKGFIFTTTRWGATGSKGSDYREFHDHTYGSVRHGIFPRLDFGGI